MKKQILSLLLAVSVLMGGTAFAAAEFTDVSESDYFYNAVNWGVEAGITSGVGDNLFAPDGEVTRAQVVTFLWNKAGKPIVTATETFSDVEAGSWYENAVAWAVENGITMGTGDNMFSPDVICNRAMCITLLYRLMGSPFDAADSLEAVDEELSMENMTMEEFSNSVTKSFIDSLRENGTILDVNSDDYYELSVFWATINGIIDENTVSISEEGIRFSPNDACVRKEMISFLYKTKLLEDAANAPVEIYFGEDLALPIPQEYYNNEILAMEVYGLYDEDEDYGDEEDEDELAVIVSESASQAAAEALGEDTEGQGELFRIIRVSEDRLHNLLCGDMSGMDVFAKDKKDRYYIICYPTDVRYVRETTDKMNEDIEAWTEVNEGARDNMGNKIIAQSKGLSPVSFTNTMLDMYLARIAYAKDVKYTISNDAYGVLEPGDFDGTEYAEYLIGDNFVEAEDAKAPEGNYIVINFPDDDVHYDFFVEDQTLVREVRGDYETFYRSVFSDSIVSTDTVEAWYFAIAEKLGKKEDYKEIDAFLGEWVEEIAGRGAMTIKKSAGLMKADIEVRWPGSAFAVSNWSITANLSYDGKLVYEKCKHTETEYDEDGNGSVVSEVTDEGGVISLDNEGKLIWKIDNWDEESTFVKQ